jgi:hypothetical protein
LNFLALFISEWFILTSNPAIASKTAWNWVIDAIILGRYSYDSPQYHMETAMMTKSVMKIFLIIDWPIFIRLLIINRKHIELRMQLKIFWIKQNFKKFLPKTL